MGLQPQRLSLFSEFRESMIPVIFILESLKQQVQKKFLKNFLYIKNARTGLMPIGRSLSIRYTVTNK